MYLNQPNFLSFTDDFIKVYYILGLSYVRQVLFSICNKPFCTQNFFSNNFLVVKIFIMSVFIYNSFLSLLLVCRSCGSALFHHDVNKFVIFIFLDQIH